MLYSPHYDKFATVKASIDGCLRDLGTRLKDKMQTLMTRKFQLFSKIRKLDRVKYMKASHENIKPSALSADEGPKAAVSHGYALPSQNGEAATLAELLPCAAQSADGKTIVYMQADGGQYRQDYRGLLLEAREIQCGLHRLGVGVQDNLLVLLTEPRDIVPLFWGCMLAGVAPLIAEVPAHFDPSDRALGHACELIALLEAKAVVLDANSLPLGDQLRKQLAGQAFAALPLQALKGSSDFLDSPTREPADVAFFCVTSGSTGKPKCVPISHLNAMARSRGTNHFNAHGRADVYLNWLPFDHIGSLGEHIRCIVAGCDMVYLHKEHVLGDPINLLRTIDQHRITHSWGPNFIFSLMRDALAKNSESWRGDLSSVKFIISGGEPVSRQMMQEFLAFAGRFRFPLTGCRPSYGMAEVCAGITYGQPTAEEPLQFVWVENSDFNGEDVRKTVADVPGAKGFADLGYPIPGVSLRIVDAENHVLPEETIGHLQLKGDVILKEYYKDPEFNALCFKEEGWFDTGDLGFISEGKLILTGRAKAMLIINGQNYYSHEIESVVEELEGVDPSFTAACAVRGEDSVTDTLAIFFHPLTAETGETHELIRLIRQAVVSRMRLNPGFIIPVEREQIPRTPIGKIQHNQLASLFNAGYFSQAAEQRARHQEEGPRNSLERLMCGVWREVLGVPAGIHDNFFDLGGDSIKAVMVMNLFQDQVGGIFHPVSLFDAPTVSTLVEYLQAHYPIVFNEARPAPLEGQGGKLDVHQLERMRGYLAGCLCSPEVHSDVRGAKNRKAVFILSPARSGSTLLRVILAGNPCLFSPPELYLLGFNDLSERRDLFSGRLGFLREGLVRAIMDVKACGFDEASALMDEMEARNLSVKAAYASLQAWIGPRLLVDKTPPYAFNRRILERMEAEFDEPLYLHLVRHPAGMIASFEEARVDLAVKVMDGEEPGKALTTLQRAELWWLVSHQNIRNFLRGIPKERQYRVEYERLVSSPEPEVREICRFLDIPFSPDMLDVSSRRGERMAGGAHEYSRLAGDPKFHLHSGISASSAERWRERFPRDFLSSFTWQLARDYGYGCKYQAQVPTGEIVPDEKNRHEPFPLTDIQQAYWAGRLADFELGGYSVHSYTEVDSRNLDLARLRAAWQKMIRRHEMLRAVILPDGRQQILDFVPEYHIDLADLAGLGRAEVQQRLEAIRVQLSHQVFASDQWPLFEIRATRIQEGLHRIHLSFDAILFDARSRYILFAEFRRFYHQPELELPPFSLSFRDYVQREQELKGSAAYAASRDYWLVQIDKLPPAPDLPLAVNPSELKNPKFRQNTHFVPASEWRRLKQSATERRVTPSCLLLTAFADVLRLWSRQESFTLNLTVYNRQPLHREVNEIIGDFTSIILLAVEAPGGETFYGRARNLQRLLWEHLSHNLFSGVEVLRELARRNNQRGGALMPVVFTSVLGDEIQEEGQSTTDWLGEIVYNVAQTPQIWFDHIAFEEGGGLLVRWNVVECLFPTGVMDAMFAAYLKSLRDLLEAESAWEALWPEVARRRLPPEQLLAREEANRTASPVSSGLLQTLFAEQAAARGKALAVIGHERSLSYEELFAFSNQLGRRLQRLGVRPQTLVAVSMEKGWQQVVAVLGVLAAGAAYVPVDPDLPEERFRHLMEFAEVGAVVTTESLLPLLGWPPGVPVVAVEAAAGSDESPAALPALQSPEDLAYVIFTSGSTGSPKGVMIDHRGAVNTILDVNSRFGVGPADRAIALSALSFDLSVYDIFGLLAAGGAVVMPRSADIRNPASWHALLQRHGVTLWNTVPAFMGLLAEYLEDRPEAVGHALRLAMLSGDWIPLPLPGKVKRLFHGCEVVSLGGATEASIWSILYPIGRIEPQWASIPYGKPMLNQQFHVLNPTLENCPVWVPGKLYIGGVGLAKGYWRDAERTAAVFINHPRSGERLYCTGDLGRYLPDGNIEFLGREDFQVKIQGFRVEAGEVEAALLRHPAVRAAVVDARGRPSEGRRLVAYAVCEPGLAVEAEALKQFLSEKLPFYMVPAAYVFLAALPLSGNGKVDRKALPDPVAAAVPAPGDKDDSGSEGGFAVIRGIVESVLGAAGIGLDDNVFYRGATSIHMMRIANQIETQTGIRPAIDSLYAHPTLRGFHKAYTEAAATAEQARPHSLVEACAVAATTAKLDFIADPEDRKAFRQSQPGLRRLGGPVAALTAGGIPAQRYAQRRSHRRFLDRPVDLGALGDCLSCLRQTIHAQSPKYLYGSAGGLYPVQTYLYAKPGRVAGLAEGIYYHDPVKHSLVFLSDGQDFDEGIYNPQINRPIFKQSAFAVFLIADLSAIVPMYRDLAMRFIYIEAGLMTQLLENLAVETGLGMCQIGEVDFERVRHLFRLAPSHVLAHSILGGVPDAGAEASEEAPTRWYSLGGQEPDFGREDETF